MALDKTTGIYVPSSASECRDDILEDLTYAFQAAGVANPPTQLGSDNWLRCDAFGRGLYLAYKALEYKGREVFITSATEDASVEDRASMFGLTLPPDLPARGRIKLTVGGTANVNSSHTFVLPNGIQGHVDGTYSGLVDGGEVSVVMDTTGVAGNAIGGTKVKFINTPVNVASEAYVSYVVPLTGGRDLPQLTDKKNVVKERLRAPIGAGTPADLVKAAKDAGVDVASVSVYCAPAGPSSEKVVPLKRIYPDAGDYSRLFDQDALERIRKSVHTKGGPWGEEVFVTNALEEPTDVAVGLQLAKGGWVDAVPWPTNRTTVSAVGTASPVVTVTGNLSAPSVGNAIMWWSKHTKKFYKQTIKSIAGSVLTLSGTFIDDEGNFPEIGDYISAAAVEQVDIGKKVVEYCGRLVPGENTLTNWRSARQGDTGESGIYERALKDTIETVTGVEAVVLLSGDAYPGFQFPDAPPLVLTLQSFAIYPEG